jgi:hypothetical protein
MRRLILNISRVRDRNVVMPRRNIWRDIEMAEEALGMMRVRGERLDINSVLPFTEMLVNDQWSNVQLIASYLLARRELSYDDVLALVQC